MEFRNKIKKFSKQGFFHIAIGNFATKFVSFFGSVFLARLLSKTDLGILTYMENLASYIYLIVGLGLSYAILRYCVRENEIERKYAYFKFSVNNSAIINIIFIGIALIVNYLYPYPEDFSVARRLLPLLILALPFRDLLSQSLMTERAMFNNTRYAVLSLASTAVVILARWLGARYNGLYGVVLAMLISEALISSIMITSSWRKYFKQVKAVILDPAEKKQAFSYSLQMMVTNGLWALFMLTNTFMLGQFSGDSVVLADFKIANTFPANLALFSSGIGIFVGPYFTKKEEDPNWVRKSYLKTLRITTVIQLGAAIIIFIFAKPLLWIFGEQYYNVIPVMRWLTIGSFINTGLRFPTANILSSIGRAKFNMIISAIGFVLLVFLNLLLIPRFGSTGLAYSSIIVYCFMAISLFIVFNNLYQITDYIKEKITRN